MNSRHPIQFQLKFFLFFSVEMSSTPGFVKLSSILLENSSTGQKLTTFSVTRLGNDQSENTVTAWIQMKQKIQSRPDNRSIRKYRHGLTADQSKIQSRPANKLISKYSHGLHADQIEKTVTIWIANMFATWMDQILIWISGVHYSDPHCRCFTKHWTSTLCDITA